MGTSSAIGYELADHTVVSVYCHWDGYVEGNGKILVEHYQNRDDVKQLIDGGSMSALRTRNTWNSGSMLRDENGEYIMEFTPFLDEDGNPVDLNPESTKVEQETELKTTEEVKEQEIES